jgi:hypothetical protein
LGAVCEEAWNSMMQQSRMRVIVSGTAFRSNNVKFESTHYSATGPL